jgi:hypothetical protein
MRDRPAVFRVDIPGMRLPPALPVVAALAAALLAGCAPGADKELQALLDDVVPVDHQLIGCEWQKNWGSGPDAYYGCTYVVQGRGAQVTGILATALDARRFAVACASGPAGWELLAARERTIVYAAVHTTSADNSIPRGQVGVELAATKGGERPAMGAGGRCPAF